MSKTRRQFLKTSCLALSAGLAFTTRAFARPTIPTTKFDSIVSRKSKVTCPVCNTQQTLNIPGEARVRVYHCPRCLTWLAPKKGDHCIFDSYGSVPSQEIQVKRRRLRGLPIPTGSA